VELRRYQRWHVNKGAPQLALRTAQEVISLEGKNTRGRKDKQAVAELNHSLNPDIQSEGKLGNLGPRPL
jgi:hypothetical protein